ncbi:rhodanese-related sulfurtransferase [Xanthobacter agilis]|uniref:Rhodanese-related sulfurtransferase n=1 Tax=Xanthobacter agilis TaxID=47492 RepID=A0ABU0LI60_XANAG|nr:rhodanese-related sulfurtransferase [Xanthobacter agilis]MDQ0506813.1 rhodanese-related sulfurtransferase [Xanthobacter agilis]
MTYIEVATFPSLSFEEVRARLLGRQETALLDVREEDPFAQEHPLWAANLPLSRIELDAFRRIPRRDTVLVLYGRHAGEDLAPQAARKFIALGYTAVHLLEGGLEGWRTAGGELFRDVNVPSKSFGELVEHERHTPSLSAEEVSRLIADKADVVVVDARRFDEYRTMSIPTATSVPGAELVLRVRELAPDPATRVVVNCAGRTRSIIGTQSLVNAGLPNPVAALRNGTIGWLLAGQELDRGAERRPPEPTAATRAAAREDARAVAARAGVQPLPYSALADFASAARTTYLLDVRTPEEYEAGHLPGFLSAPGGQLVQETDHHAPVRGARFVLFDTDDVRAPMTGSWLAQMGWEVHFLEGVPAEALTAIGAAPPNRPAMPEVPLVTAAALVQALDAAQGDPGSLQIIDVSPGVDYLRGHVPGSWFAIRAQLADALKTLPSARRYVVTCGTGILARFATADLAEILGPSVDVAALDGGNAAWHAADHALEQGEIHLAVPRTDRYRRPYEGTEAPRSAMQAYLDWEFGLVAQLARDGTHHFRVV